jgi:hypothetical protein
MVDGSRPLGTPVYVMKGANKLQIFKRLAVPTWVSEMTKSVVKLLFSVSL